MMLTWTCRRGSQKKSKKERTSIPICDRKSEKTEKEDVVGAIPLVPVAIEEDSMLQNLKEMEKKEAKEKEAEQLAISVFKRLADEGKVHHDDMQKAMSLMGYVNPNQEWIDKAFDKISRWSSIGLEEFQRLCVEYGALQQAYYKEEFSACDDDGSGTVEASELR